MKDYFWYFNLDEGMMQDYCSNSADMKDYFWYFTTVGGMIQDYCSRSAVMKDYFWYFNLDEGMMQDYCSRGVARVFGARGGRLPFGAPLRRPPPPRDPQKTL